jgi:hypothetical protein
MELKVVHRVNTHPMPESDQTANSTSVAGGAADALPDPQPPNTTSLPLLQPKLIPKSTWTDAFMKPPGYKNLNASNWRWPPKLVQPIPPSSETNAKYCIIL